MPKLKTYTTESVMVREGESPVYGDDRIIIRVDSQGGGPFLVVRGATEKHDDDGTENDIFFESEGDIDAFADTCKSMLAQAEAAEHSPQVATVK